MKLYRLFLILLLLILPLGQLSRIPIGGSTIVIYLNDILLPLILLLWVVSLFQKKHYRFPFLTVPIALFIAIDFVSLLWNTQVYSSKEIAVSFLYLLRWIEYVGIYFVFSEMISQLHPEEKEKEVRFFITILIGVGTAIAIFGLIQYVLFPDFSPMVAQGWDPHYYRVLSTFFDPNFVGAFLVLSLIMVIALSFEVKSWQKVDLIKGSVAVILLLAIVLTFSRSTYLMFVISMGIFGIIRSRKLLLLGILMGILTLILVPRVQERIIGGFINIDASASLRFESWEAGLQIFKENPIIGVGYNSYRYAQIRYGIIEPWVEQDVNSHASSGVDSSLILILATTGILGCGVYVWFLLKHAILGLWTYFNVKNSLGKVLGITVLAGIVGLFVHSQFVNSLLYPFILEWMMIAVGMLEGLGFGKGPEL